VKVATASIDGMTTPADFAARLLDWFDQHGRHDLPWQHPRSPFRVWLAEIMLQQTQVATALPYFQRFVEALPNICALAEASEDQVLGLWSGLGYYSRARNLHRAARLCVERHGGELPADYDALSALPGIGRSTAGAILAQAFGKRFAILDGNVKRSLTRLLGITRWPGEAAVTRQLWSAAEALLPALRLADYTQAMMDFGATLCTRSRPGCSHCPFRADCVALREDRVANLPVRKPGRALPTRSVVMLWLENSTGQIALQRREGRGVWQGLWSLPEAPDRDDAERWLARHVRFDPVLAHALPAFAHVFSHYRLSVQPLHIRGVEPLPAVAEIGTPRWFERAELAMLGLPAPVRRLLTQTNP
jgi:A/G-specific adenine glycosylase